MGRFFNGTSDIIDIGSSLGLSALPVTMAAWIKTTLPAEVDALSVGQNTGAGSRNCLYFGVDVNGHVVANCFVAGAFTQVAGVTIASTTTWIHIAAVFASGAGNSSPPTVGRWCTRALAAGRTERRP